MSANEGLLRPAAAGDANSPALQTGPSPPWTAALSEEKTRRPIPQKAGRGQHAAQTPAAVISQSGRTSLEYDIAHKMVRLHVKLGEAGAAGPKGQPVIRPGSWAEVFKGSHSAKTNFRLVRLKPGERESWEVAKSLELMQKSVNTTEGNYQRAIMLTGAEDMTVMHKTSLGLGELNFIPSEILGLSLDGDAIKHAEILGFRTERVFIQDNGTSIVRLSMPPNMDAIRAQGLLSKEFPGFRFELNKLYRLYRAQMYQELEAPKTPQPGESAACDAERCFSHNLIQWQDDLAACAQGVKVGVIDTAIDFKHPAFKDITAEKASFTQEGRPAAPEWHGTGVLALLAGNPASHTPGLIPKAEFYAASIFYIEEGGGMTTDTISLLKALQWMKDNRVDIINMSFSGPEDSLVRDAIDEMSRGGTVFVAAAGNDGPLAVPAFPAAYPQVIAVTAVTREKRNYWYANRGRHIDVAEPGVDIWTAVPGGREGFHSGTSFAAPHATAIVALMIPSLAKDAPMPKSEILAHLPYVDLGKPGRDEIYGRGLLVAPSVCPPPLQEVASAGK
jgi:hypothetical protein